MNDKNMNNIKIKKNELCEKMMDKYLSLDKNEVVPLRLTLHLLKCQKCRTEVHYLSLAEKIAAKPLKERFTAQGLKSTVKNVIPQMKNPITMTKWVIGGIIMTLFLLIFGIASKNCAPELQLLFYIFFAFVVSSYCAVFIAKNLDYFIKKFNTMNQDINLCKF